MKKVILTKSNSNGVRNTSILKITSPDIAKSKLAYAELFRALLQIPEKDVQLRILDAVNGRSSTEQIIHAICPNCKDTFNAQDNTRTEVATQTELNEADSTTTNTSVRIIARPLDSPQHKLHPISSNDVSNDHSLPTPEIINEIPEEQQPNVEITTANASSQSVKKKRKRKLCLPQVVKWSQAQMAQTQGQPKLKKRKVEMTQHIDQAMAHGLNAEDIMPQYDSIGLFAQSDNWFDNFLNIPSLETPEERSKEEYVLRTMAKECLESETRTDGLLPIHRAVVENDIFTLRRQIFVWKTWKKKDLNDLLTDENENCLQLAIANNCFPKIIDVLFNTRLNAQETDDNSNTCVHLAILNEIEAESLRLLMQRIDLNMLLHLNDDGYTSLHMAVRADSFLHAEIILNAMDERLGQKALSDRSAGKGPTKMEFHKHYEQSCKQLEIKFSNGSRNAQPKLKKKFLEAGDRKSGNTALFFAIENKLEHFVLFLLAHLTDPRVLNFSGQDAKSFYSEYGKTLNLSLKVDNAMERVVALLD